MNISVEKLNKIFKEIQFFPNNKELKYLERQEGHKGVPEAVEGYQGEYNEYSEIYKINEFDDLFLKVTYNTDSYGENDFVVSIQFAKPKQVNKTIYEPI